MAIRGVLRDVFDVLLDAGRLLGRHWPVILSWTLLGVAWRGGVMWAAVVVSDWQGWAGRGLLILAPLGFLIPLVVLLHHVKDDLPNVARAAAVKPPPDATTGHPRRLIDVATSVLVPFLAVYVSYGFMAQDLDQFVNEAGADEYFSSVNQGILTGRSHADFSRVLVNRWEVLLMLIAGAWVLRFVLARAEKRWKFLALAVAGALVETYWTTNTAGYVETSKGDVQSWLSSRVAVTAFQTRYDALMNRLGAFGHPIDAATSWLWGLLGSFDAVVIVPLAWITVATVVLGHTLAPPPPAQHRILDRARRLPKPVQRGAGLLGGLFADVRSRFSALVNGLRMMARAGLLPMLLFGLAFLVALRTPYAFTWVWRHVVGPQPSVDFVGFAPIEYALGQAASLTLLVVLLAAAVDRMLLPGTPAPLPGPTAPPPSHPPTYVPDLDATRPRPRYTPPRPAFDPDNDVTRIRPRAPR